MLAVFAAAFLAATMPIAMAGPASPTIQKRAAPTVPIVEYIFPPSRGTNVGSAKNGPCQGFEIGGRFEYPLKGGDISLFQSRDATQVQIAYSTSSDPKSVSDFSPVGQNISQVYGGNTCLPGPDFSALGLSAGQDITLKLEYISGPAKSSFYECADLKLVEPSQYMRTNHTCVNVTESTQTKGQTPAGVSSTAKSSSSSGLSNAASGGIGAGVTVGVFLIALLAAWKMGYAAFGKNAARKWKSDATMMDERFGPTKSITSTIA